MLLDPSRIHALSLEGGDPSSGELVFRNQGACLQCHKIDDQGGEQGPELSLVGDRMEPSKLLESLVNPNAEISPGYGLSTISMRNGEAMVGRVLAEEDDTLVLLSPDGKQQEIKKKLRLRTFPLLSQRCLLWESHLIQMTYET